MPLQSATITSVGTAWAIATFAVCSRRKVACAPSAGSPSRSSSREQANSFAVTTTTRLSSCSISSARHATRSSVSTLTTNGIAAAQVPVAGTAMTLVASTAAGITVGQSITRSDTGATVTGLRVIDGQSAAVAFGSSGGNNLWDPTKALARCLTFTSAGDDSAATALVRGYDIYWYPMTESVTLTNASAATSKKAFKYIASITPAGTLSGSNLSVGQSDTIGFPMRSDLQTYAQIYFPDTTLISATTGYTAAVTTDPATTTTGDVRGTYALQTASNNTRPLVVRLAIPLANLATAKGLVGVTQV